AAQRVWPIELDVVGVMLNAFQHSVAAGIPSAGHPRKFNSLLHAWPQIAQPLIVAAELPIEPRMNDLPHLAVGGGKTRSRFAIRQQLSKMHGAGIVHRIPEGALAQRSRKRGKEKWSCDLVVPYMR